MVDTKELIEALHYINKFRNHTFIIKFGGEILSDRKVLNSVASDMVLLHGAGIHLVVIHGAGVVISSAMKKHRLKPRFIRGERVTDKKTLDIVLKSLHYVNNEITGVLNRKSSIAVGLESGLFEAKVKKEELGYVGEVTAVKSRIIQDLIESNHLPVVSPVGIDTKEGQLLNINADVAAGELAKALKVTKMIILTNVEGVLDDKGGLIKRLTIKDAEKIIKKGVATEGMIPKIESAVKAISKDVKRVHIVKAGEHAILGELLTEEGMGTMIVKRSG